MTMEPNPTQDHILDCWLEDTVPFIPYFLDDPYGTAGNTGDYPFWVYGQEDTDQYNIHAAADAASPTATTTTTAAAVSVITTPAEPFASSNSPSSDSSKKRKASHELKPSQNQKPKKNHSRTTTEAENHGGLVVEGTTTAKRTFGNKKGGSKANVNNHNNGNNKEGRWAEQLLNPCAAAITACNQNRVQHLLYVLHELASPTGDANHRLAAHGLRALIRHLSSSTSSSAATVSGCPSTFASADPQFFQRSLLKFYEVSPWFSFPSNIANSSILQILAEESSSSRTLHIVDIGVSHGVQWPTFLEALTHRPGGPPPLVRLTVVAASTENDQNLETPFSVGPRGDFYSSRLLGFAKTMNINLQIRKVDNQPLQKLDAQIIDTSPDENLIVCAQFRLHSLSHNIPDERTEFLSVLRKMEPKGVIMCENNMECSCNSCGNFTVSFSRSVDFLWKFLDSTSSAYKGRESEERQLMEGEAAKALINQGEMNEGKEKWCERMKEAGFAGGILGEEAIDGARALLRKYDNNWEMRVEENNAGVGLWWKGQPVSFCSLWKLDENENGGSGSTLRARI